MAIESVNTIEIRLFDSPDAALEDALQCCIERLKGAPGCIDYVLNRGALWVLCGYWDSEALMTDSFDSEHMAQLVNVLIEAGASLVFASFVAQAAIADVD